VQALQYRRASALIGGSRLLPPATKDRIPPPMNADARRSKNAPGERRTAVCYENVAAVEIGPEVALRLAKQLECKYPQRRTGLVIGRRSGGRTSIAERGSARRYIRALVRGAPDTGKHVADDHPALLEGRAGL
jgi:hypothetical protein